MNITKQINSDSEALVRIKKKYLTQERKEGREKHDENKYTNE